MAEIKVPKKGPIKVKKKPDDLVVKIKLPTKDVPHPADFNLFWMLADVYIVKMDYEEGYFLEENQVAEIKNGEVKLEVDIPRYIRNRIGIYINTLRLLYYNETNRAWEVFTHDEPGENTESVIITIPNPWIKDPPVGWGGNEPR